MYERTSDQDDRPTLRIGEVAQLLGATARSLRFYEEQGLVRPRRTAGGARRYSVVDVEQFRLILRLARVGLSLQQIREIASIRRESRTGDEASRKVYEAMEQVAGQVYQQLRECQAVLQDVTRLKSEVVQCFGCDRAPTPEGCAACPIYEKLQSAPLFGIVAAVEHV